MYILLCCYYFLMETFCKENNLFFMDKFFIGKYFRL